MKNILEDLQVKKDIESMTLESLKKAKQKFVEVFGDTRNASAITAPVALMLLGDHTHYNDGILLSVQLNAYTTVILRKRKDYEIKIYNAINGTLSEFNFFEIPQETDVYTKYVLGITRLLKADNLINRGFEALFFNDAPDCIGLGKISSIQIGFLCALRKAFRLNCDGLLSYVHKNELELLGKISNVAQHLTIHHSKKNKFFFVDLRTLQEKQYNYNSEYELVILDTGNKIIDSLSICNERIEECEIGVKGLRLYIWGIKNLRDVSLEFLLRHIHMLPRRIFNRILYNVKERIRVEEAIDALKKRDYRALGNIISQSHWSLSEDYGLSDESCDFIVRNSENIDCVYGSKMISCSQYRSTFQLVRKECAEDYIDHIKKLYQEKFKKELYAYRFQPAEGMREYTSKDLDNI
ncbi:galactokinase [Melioribacter sp. OK-6-Me]|uniref:galactokinase n=1 Tax=unclassified Melioribacter TaxID=2627329 RepID=UPI003ED9473C